MNRVGIRLTELADVAHRELGELLNLLPDDQAARGALLYELIAMAKLVAPLIHTDFEGIDRES